MSVLSSVDLDTIELEARQVNFGKGLLTVIAAILFAIGFMFGVASRALAWTAVAIRLGYRAGRKAGVSSAQLARAG
jgi:hypothetical protein